MLQQMSHSSKRLEKIKKYKTKLGGSGFDFLLQSMDRDKENHVPNAHPIHYGHLTQSVNIDSQVTVPASHIHPMLRSTNMMLHSTKPNIYVDNVKILDCSAESISDVNEFNHSKQTNKNYLSNKQVERQLLSSKIPMKRSQIVSKITEKSNVSSLIDRSDNRNVDRHQFEDLLSKVKYYLLLSNDMVGTSSQISSKAKSKLKRYGQELDDLMRTMKAGWTQEQWQLNHERGSIKMRNSYMMRSKQSEDYLKVINKLESEREKLNNLISKHELANIKMFVKINEGESEEIERCKKQLALLFNKYKELEKIIKRDKQELIALAKEKRQLVERNVFLLQQNKQLSLALETLGSNHHRSPSYLSIHSSERFRHSNQKENEPQKVKQGRPQVGFSNFESSLNSRGDLRIQSLKNSHISYEEQAPRSSISTITSRINPKKGGKIGINLNALVDSIKHQNFKKLLDQPQRLKKIVQECRKTILQMEHVINQQNQELQLCIKTLEENQQKLTNVEAKLNANESKLNANESKLESTQQQLKKQRVQRMQLEMLLSKQKQKHKMNKNKSTKKAWNDIDYRSQHKEDRIKVYDEKDVFVLDLGVDLKYMDQYRIIATQAKTLEKCLKQKQNR